LLFLGGDSPDTMARSEAFGLFLMAGGLIAVLIGMVTHVVQLNRSDRRL